MSLLKDFQSKTNKHSDLKKKIPLALIYYTNKQKKIELQVKQMPPM